MAEKIQLKFQFKKQVPADYEDIKDVLAKRLRVKVKREKVKAKTLLLVTMAKDPAAVTEESILSSMKRTAHRKDIKSVSVEL